MKIVKSAYEGKDNIFVHPASCFHIGHNNCRYDLIKNWIDKLDYKNRGLLLGDQLEFATKESIGHGLFDTTMTPQSQIDYLVEALREKAEFIDGVVLGNHEERGVRMTSIDSMKIVCDALKIPYLNYQGFVKYIVNDKSYLFNMWHGHGGGSTPSTAIQVAERMADRALSDVYCIGHFHKKIKSDRIYAFPDVRNMKVVPIEQHFVVCGSALGYEDGYAEQTGLMPRILGFPKIELFGDKKEKHIEVTI